MEKITFRKLGNKFMVLVTFKIGRYNIVLQTGYMDEGKDKLLLDDIEKDNKYVSSGKLIMAHYNKENGNTYFVLHPYLCEMVKNGLKDFPEEILSILENQGTPVIDETYINEHPDRVIGIIRYYPMADMMLRMNQRMKIMNEVCAKVFKKNIEFTKLRWLRNDSTIRPNCKVFALPYDENNHHETCHCRAHQLFLYPGHDQFLKDLKDKIKINEIVIHNLAEYLKKEEGCCDHMKPHSEETKK